MVMVHRGVETEYTHSQADTGLLYNTPTISIRIWWLRNGSKTAITALYLQMPWTDYLHTSTQVMWLNIESLLHPNQAFTTAADASCLSVSAPTLASCNAIRTIFSA